MEEKTKIKAELIIQRNGVKPVHESNKIKHFKVLQASGEWTDVFVTNVHGRINWSCNAKAERDDGTIWSCCLNSQDNRDKVYCSHTLAVLMFMEKREEKENETNKPGSLRISQI